MISNYFLFESQSNVTLTKFDKKFLDSMPEKSEIVYNDKSSTFNTILVGGVKAGVVGVVTFGGWNYLQIILLPEYRGKNIVSPSVLQFVKKHKLKRVYATIHSSNVASIKSLKRLGFKEPPQEVEVVYSKKRPPNHIGLMKDYL